MAAIETILTNNSIVKRLIAGGDITLEQLKKIYHAYCKMTHPDLMHRDGREFIRLQTEYEEAIEHWDELAVRLVGSGRSTLLRAADIRRMFYTALRHYLAAGLYSSRVRIKPEIKKRNELILREVLSWAQVYRPPFIPVFLEYNKTYLRRYLEWRKRDNLAKAQRLLVAGLRGAVDYESDRSVRTLRSARSYFRDCLCLTDILPPTQAAAALRGLAAWFTGELETLDRRREPETTAGSMEKKR